MINLKTDKEMDEHLLNKSIAPMHKFYDETVVPFGDWEDDGDFHIYYDTASRYGYMAKPIYGVAVELNHEKGEPTSYRYKIFIGEAPHKNENGEWVTYNVVPSFYIGAFGGAHYLKEEPDIPHIIHISTDEWFHQNKEREYEENKLQCAANYELRHKIEYCSFKMYMHGLWNRIQNRIGTFSKYKGKHSNLYHYYAPKNGVSYHFVNHWESKSLYFYKETEEWIYWTYFRKDGKWGIHKDKTTNDHCGCEA